MTTPAFDKAAGRLSGKVALVVGGGATHDTLPGTGSAMARLFAAAGAKVAVLGRTREKTESTVHAITAAGGEAVAVIADASVRADAERAVAEVEHAYGSLDILVNNLGIWSPGTAVDLDIDEWDRVVATNLTSVLQVSRPAERLLANSHGCIINIGSVAGLRSGGNSFTYGATKGALVAMTRDMAFGLGSKGIRVNLIAPGHLHTPVGSEFASDDARQLRNDVNMLGIEGTAWDVAWTALFLASDEARFITAVTLPVDAGAAEVLPLFAVAMDRERR